MAIGYMKTDESLSVHFKNGDIKTIQSRSPHYRGILNAVLADESESKIRKLFDLTEAIKTYSEGKITIKDGAVYYNKEIIRNSVSDRIVRFMAQGLPWKPLARFLENLMLNPSYNSRQSLYSFLENEGMSITDRGTVLGFKGVRADGYSVHGDTNVKLIRGRKNSAGQIYNGVGEVIQVDRSYVDDNTNNGCSRGLHIGSYAYANGWSDRVVLVEFNPKDAVCVPHAEISKLRVCEYKVIADKASLMSDYTPDEDECPLCGAPLAEVTIGIVKLPEVYKAVSSTLWGQEVATCEAEGFGNPELAKFVRAAKAACLKVKVTDPNGRDISHLQF